MTDYQKECLVPSEKKKGKAGKEAPRKALENSPEIVHVPARGGEERETGLTRRGRLRGLPHPISEAEEFTHFPAFIAALLHLRGALIRHAEGVFVCSNEVDHHVGCFHQDVFPFRLLLFESLFSLNDANYGTAGTRAFDG